MSDQTKRERPGAVLTRIFNDIAAGAKHAKAQRWTTISAAVRQRPLAACDDPDCDCATPSRLPYRSRGGS